MQIECVAGNCSSGTKCSNQCMQDGTSPALTVKKLLDIGMFLFAVEDIMTSSVVCKYTGDVISGREYRRWTKELLGTANYYEMDVGKTEVIDARHHGSLARFANHSCRPNCVVDIHAGEEVTFKYGADSKRLDVRPAH
ncbi:hypothetical protein JG688_00013060 [Phytophthora aleatoria]|uniref:SET domain-containing protein n=1 Tax=Phytophthora aleatoria TaxID=2496075 RepID=A0A8J5IJP5_9STRA|nr:hypothetical protein JG688_00013060 [Phytophthora aleatoria]